MKKIWLSVALASSSLFLTACNDDHDDTSVVVVEDGIPKYNFSAPVVKTELYRDQGENANNLLNAVSSSKTLMTYKMLGVNGRETQATALVLPLKQLNLRADGHL